MASQGEWIGPVGVKASAGMMLHHCGGLIHQFWLEKTGEKKKSNNSCHKRVKLL